MALEMVLNDLSLQPAGDIYSARQWMSDFVQTVKTATSHRVSRVIRTQSDIFDVVLAENYPMRRWLNDGDVDRVARQYVKRLTTKAPFWDGLPDLYQRVQSSAFEYDEKAAHGLGIAYLLEGLALSLPSEECWNTARLSLNALLDEDGEIETVSVIHASHPNHIGEHKEWIQERLRSDIEDGEDLWNRRSELLPSLKFCEGVDCQMSELSPTMLRPVARRLFELDAYCYNWTEGGFDPDQFPARATPESQATLQRYEDERVFLCPDGVERLFSWHVRVTPGSWRIYFDPEPGPGAMFIGYIGPHLPTVMHH